MDRSTPRPSPTAPAASSSWPSPPRPSFWSSACRIRVARMTPDRRAVLAGTGALAAAGPVGAAPPPAVTRILAKYLVGAQVGDIPAQVRREGCRTLLNY